MHETDLIFENINKISRFHLNKKVIFIPTKYNIEPKSYEFSKKYELKPDEILIMQMVGMIISFITMVKALRTFVTYRYGR
uniref:Glucuronosyltransferase n=1 Tax=Strongyloides papillosus TaxID=174720 RepID=A0A0N5CAY4_STREA